MKKIVAVAAGALFMGATVLPLVAFADSNDSQSSYEQTVSSSTHGASVRQTKGNQQTTISPNTYKIRVGG